MIQRFDYSECQKKIPVRSMDVVGEPHKQLESEAYSNRGPSNCEPSTLPLDRSANSFSLIKAWLLMAYGLPHNVLLFLSVCVCLLLLVCNEHKVWDSQSSTIQIHQVLLRYV